MKRYLIIPGVCCGVIFWCLVVSFSQSADELRRESPTDLSAAFDLQSTDQLARTDQKVDELIDRKTADRIVRAQVVLPMSLSRSHKHFYSRAAVRIPQFESTFELATESEGSSLFLGVVAEKNTLRSGQHVPFVVDRKNGAVTIFADGKWQSAAKWGERFQLTKMRLPEENRSRR